MCPLLAPPPVAARLARCWLVCLQQKRPVTIQRSRLAAFSAGR
eukprot:COSAG06_NODE_2492_length_6769_cov_2.361619_9_plen_43_part_00